jgi:hypothetical protein
MAASTALNNILRDAAQERARLLRMTVSFVEMVGLICPVRQIIRLMARADTN